MQKRDNKPIKKVPFLKALKGAVFALVLTIAAILILAFIVKEGNISDGAINAVNQIIKVVSIFTAAFIASRAVDGAFAFTGAISGALYVVLGYLAFSLIDGKMGDIVLLLADMAMGLAIGMLTAIIFGKFLRGKKSVRKK